MEEFGDFLIYSEGNFTGHSPVNIIFTLIDDDISKILRDPK